MKIDRHGVGPERQGLISPEGTQHDGFDKSDSLVNGDGGNRGGAAAAF